jgi:Phage protein
LRVSERTVHNWEAGRVRIPYAAYKLIRILRGYELPGFEWKGYRLIGDTLWSPENRPFRAADARWWTLTVQMAHEYRRQSKARQAKRTAENGALATVENGRLAMPNETLLGLNRDQLPAPVLNYSIALRSSSPRLTRESPHSGSNPLSSNIKPLSVLSWGHNGAALLDTLNLIVPIWGHETSQANSREIQSSLASAFTCSLSVSSGSYGPILQRLLPDRFGGLYTDKTGTSCSNFLAQNNSTACTNGSKSLPQSGQERPLSVWQWQESEVLPPAITPTTLFHERGLSGSQSLAIASAASGGAL